MIIAGHPVDIYKMYKEHNFEKKLVKIDEFEKKLIMPVILLDEMLTIEEDSKKLKKYLEMKVKDPYIICDKKQLTDCQKLQEKIDILIFKIVQIKKCIKYGENNKNKILVDPKERTQIKYELPKDILKKIISELDSNEVVPLRKVSKYWKTAIDEIEVAKTYILLSSKYVSRRMILNLSAYKSSLFFQEYISLLNISRNNFFNRKINSRTVASALQTNLLKLQSKADKYAKKPINDNENQNEQKVTGLR